MDSLVLREEKKMDGSATVDTQLANSSGVAQASMPRPPEA